MLTVPTFKPLTEVLYTLAHWQEGFLANPSLMLVTISNHTEVQVRVAVSIEGLDDASTLGVLHEVLLALMVQKYLRNCTKVRMLTEIFGRSIRKRGVSSSSSTRSPVTRGRYLLVLRCRFPTSSPSSATATRLTGYASCRLCVCVCVCLCVSVSVYAVTVLTASHSGVRLL